MGNPFILDVTEVNTGFAEMVSTRGQSPVRWGGVMLAVEEGTPVEVQGTLSNLGESVMINAQVSATATGTCVLCLQDISSPFSYNISQVFGFDESFISGDELDEDDEEPLLVDEGTIDLTQLVIDEAGLNAPFRPTCADYGMTCTEETPQPDGVVQSEIDKRQGRGAADTEGISTEGISGEETQLDPQSVDPRWAALLAFREKNTSP